jgi:hypothetical protein
MSPGHIALMRMPRAAYSRAATLGEPKDAVLGGVVDPAFGASHKSPERRAIHDRAASLFAHLLQFELHATPFAAENDSHDAVVILTGGVGGLREHILDARVAIGGIEPAEGGDRLRNHGFDLRIIGDVATNGDGLTLARSVDRPQHAPLSRSSRQVRRTPPTRRKHATNDCTLDAALGQGG